MLFTADTVSAMPLALFRYACNSQPPALTVLLIVNKSLEGCSDLGNTVFCCFDPDAETSPVNKY